LEITTRLDDLLVALLKGALTALGPEQAENLAQDIGEEYGRDLATKMSPADGTRSVSAAMQAIAATLTAHGFAAHAEEVDGGTSVVSDHCPFGTAALEFPVLCAVDRGMINGMLSGLSGSRRRLGSVMLSSKARGDLSCQATA
jgi:predicted ArsR family transcriptional regulator